MEGIVSDGGLGGIDSTLASNNVDTVDVPEEALPQQSLIDKIRRSKDKNPPMLLIFAMYEYCDVFGRHRCSEVAYRYTDHDNFVSYLTFACPPDDLHDAPPKEAIILGKVPHWTELPRCEQPNEKPYNQE
jgi:hypothetical protein